MTGAIAGSGIESKIDTVPNDTFGQRPRDIAGQADKAAFATDDYPATTKFTWNGKFFTLIALVSADLPMKETSPNAPADVPEPNIQIIATELTHNIIANGGVGDLIELREGINVMLERRDELLSDPKFGWR